AELSPYRSLTPSGFRILFGGVGAVSLLVGTAFFLVGAWPVVGFLGLEILLLYWAFKINYRHAQLREHLLLSEDILIVRRTDPQHREQTWRFQPYWLRLIMPDVERPDSQLVLTSHGRRVTVGAFLAPQQRREVATDLQAALAKAHSVYHC
ncbi:MAG: DUF2244 domain-containing protein, partial [Proteobacteria bacterium]|nr:DUF2244 domain-containing protein [Pseudomonadota bacterium]